MSYPSIVTSIVGRLRAAGCVFAEAEAEMLVCAAHSPEELESMVDRRVGGLPLEQVVGWAQFCGLRIFVEPGVFVPRRRTEFLVSCAASLVSGGAVIVDLCCGAGAIAAALGALLPDAEVYAADVDPVAVGCASRNVPGPVFQGDLFEALPDRLRGRIDLLTANVPYVPTAEIALLPPEARAYEPTVSLDGGLDGLDVLRRVVTNAPSWLAAGGHLLVEASESQAPHAAAAFAAAGLSSRVVSCADFDATVIIGNTRDHNGSGSPAR